MAYQSASRSTCCRSRSTEAFNEGQHDNHQCEAVHLSEQSFPTNSMTTVHLDIDEAEAKELNT
eukprot:958543-Amphidinium_carterae.1